MRVLFGCALKATHRHVICLLFIYMRLYSRQYTWNAAHDIFHRFGIRNSRRIHILRNRICRVFKRTTHTIYDECARAPSLTQNCDGNFILRLWRCWDLWIFMTMCGFAECNVPLLLSKSNFIGPVISACASLVWHYGCFWATREREYILNAFRFGTTNHNSSSIYVSSIKMVNERWTMLTPMQIVPHAWH